jgi:dihydropteroate synthase
MALQQTVGSILLPSDRPLIMGIVNVTPDSFSDGGDFVDPAKAIAHARRLIDEGADMLDIGAESTRPGAHPTGVAEELARLRPILEPILALGVPVSVDTRRAAVMRELVALPIAMINDVSALQDPGALEICATAQFAVCLMHMQGTPQTMQLAPDYAAVAPQVFGFLQARVEACIRAGIAPQRICLDPGFGFGKTRDHSVALMRALPELCQGPYPVLVGWSRKRVLCEITGQTEPKARTSASIAVALRCLEKGAKILRVHDVRATVDAVKVWQAFR